MQPDWPADDLATPEPLFHVGTPDGNHATELQRQVVFLRTMRLLAPEVLVYANANAGRRNPMQARREGVQAGVFDCAVWWNHGCAHVEFKGRQASGRWGKLSDAQVRWGNRMHGMGHRVAAFYDPLAAVSWLRDQGCPIRLAR